MDIKPILVSLMALTAVFLVLQTVSANELIVGNPSVEINGIVLEDWSENLAVFAGETIPIKVTFQVLGDEQIEDVRVKAWISGYRSEVSDSTDRFDIFGGNWYTKRLSLKLPGDIDETEEATLVLRIETKSESDEFKYNLELQRDSYKLEILSVETDKKVVAGDNLPVTVVLKNRGLHEVEDTFAIVRIPALDVEKKVYFGDLIPQDENDCCDEEDSAERKVFLTIPSNAQEGTYKLEVEAYNLDATAVISRDIVILKSEESSKIFSGVRSKSAQADEEATFDLILVNPGNKLQVYTITPEENSNVVITIDEPIVTVPADSSRTVKVGAKGSEKGTYSFAVNVNSDSELLDRVAFSLNVSKKSVQNSSVVILTIVLAVVFIVLLIVLIALLTRKPARSEEEGESYY